MKRQTPPLEAIEAFLVASRSPSFRAAADILALSPSAFSRRIQLLEAFVGVPLIDRSGRGVVLTESGRSYLQSIEPAIDALRRTSVDLRTLHLGGPLRIMSSQSFAIGWLIPHLPQFLEQHPGVDAQIVVGRDAARLRQGLVDVAITVRKTEDLPGAEHLIEIEGAVVAAPTLVNGAMRPSCIEETLSAPLLAVTWPADSWETWLTAVGCPATEPVRATRFDTLFMVYEAAAAGLGLAIGSPLLVDRHFAEGRLTTVFEKLVPMGLSYYIDYADAAVAKRSEARAFVAWIREAITHSRQPTRRSSLSISSLQ